MLSDHFKDGIKNLPLIKLEKEKRIMVCLWLFALKLYVFMQSNEGKYQNQEQRLEREGNHSPELRQWSTEALGTVNIQEPGFTSSKWYNLRAGLTHALWKWKYI